MTSGYVYFAEAFGRIKIGFSMNPTIRMSELRSAHKDKSISLIGAIAGGRSLELALHSKFAHLSLGNEWFSDSPELRSYIADLPLDDMGGVSIKTSSVKLPDRLRRDIKAIAAMRGVSVHLIYREAVEEYLKEVGA